MRNICIEGSRNFYLFKSSVRSPPFVSPIVISRFLYFRPEYLCVDYLFFSSWVYYIVENSMFGFVYNFVFTPHSPLFLTAHTWMIPFPAEFSRTFLSLFVFFSFWIAMLNEHWTLYVLCILLCNMPNIAYHNKAEACL